MTGTRLHMSVPRPTLRRGVLALSCLLVLANIHCSRSDDRAQADPSTITVLYSVGDERSVLRRAAPASLIFLPLVSRNEAGELEGRLARRWEHSPDYRTWTIHLRTDVRWHDGVPVTAHDIKFTLDLLKHPDVLRAPPDAYSVTVLNDSTYTIAYSKRATGSPLLHGGQPFYPKHLLEELDPKEFNRWEFWTHPVGNGPYRYVRHVPKTLMEFEANPDYYRGKPRIERVVLKLGAASITELLSGNVDVIQYVNRMDLLTLAGDPRFQAYHTGGEREPAIHWNRRHPPFRDRKVRRALTLAINRRELHELVILPPETPIFDVLLTSRQLQRGELPEPLPYDPEAARHLLEEAGWRDVDRDGIRERHGTPFRFTALIPRPYWSGMFGEQAAVYIREQLRQVGIQMEILILDRPAVDARLEAGEFEAAIESNRGVSEHINPGRYYGEGALFGYTNPTAIDLLKQAEATMNPDELDRIYRELWPIFQADQPATFLYPALFTTVAHRRVRGLSTPHRFQPFRGIDDLWLEDEH